MKIGVDDNENGIPDRDSNRGPLSLEDSAQTTTLTFNGGSIWSNRRNEQAKG